MSDTDRFNFEEIKNAMAQNDDVAKERYIEFKSNDPFPEIAPALLNSADIIDYILVTGMIHPFIPEMVKKPASYAVPLLGKCVTFDEKGEKKVEIIENDKEFILKKNSIAFVTLEPYFRIPEYIALRFNLKIKNVYRGILLGTGPIVDPGFEGRLSIPLHNLTTNDYEYKAGEDLVYFEFTKLSENEKWLKYKEDKNKRIGIYIPFPERKKAREDVEDYLAHAAPHLPIRSSIPEAIRKAQISAENAEISAKKAEKTAEKIKDSIKNFTLFGTIGLSLSLVLILIGVCQIANQSTSLVRDTKESIWEVQRDMSSSKKDFNIEIENLNDKISLLEGKIDSLATQNNEKIKNSTERDEK